MLFIEQIWNIPQNERIGEKHFFFHNYISFEVVFKFQEKIFSGVFCEYIQKLWGNTNG